MEICYVTLQYGVNNELVLIVEICYVTLQYGHNNELLLIVEICYVTLQNGVKYFKYRISIWGFNEVAIKQTGMCIYIYLVVFIAVLYCSDTCFIHRVCRPSDKL